MFAAERIHADDTVLVRAKGKSDKSRDDIDSRLFSAETYTGGRPAAGAAAYPRSAVFAD